MQKIDKQHLKLLLEWKAGDSLRLLAGLLFQRSQTNNLISNTNYSYDEEVLVYVDTG